MDRVYAADARARMSKNIKVHRVGIFFLMPRQPDSDLAANQALEERKSCVASDQQIHTIVTIPQR